MKANEFVFTPGSLLLLSLGPLVAGAILVWMANRWQKAMGEDVASTAERTAHYRNMGAMEQLSAFHSDQTNMPIAMGICGVLGVFLGSFGALAAGVWFVVRLF